MSLLTCEINEPVTPSYGVEELENHVQRVAQSAQLMRAETLRKLLLYLWAHRNEEINEYAVATEALGRRVDFDPKADASVRVQVSRLRRKLKDFYETEGSGEAYMLHIPMGTHSLTILEGARLRSIPPDSEADRPPFSLITYTQPLLVIACIALLILSGWLLRDLHQKSSIATRPIVKPTSFWTSFIGSGIPVKIVLPTPVFFSYPNLSKLRIRDIDVNDFNAWKTSDGIRSLTKTAGDPKLDQSYTVASDTLASIDLARYLDMIGVADRVTFEVTGDSSMNLLEKANVIALGGHSTLGPFRDYLESMNFSLAAKEAWVENAHPTAGESQRYEFSNQGDGRKIEPAIVAVLPGRGPNLKLLILQSRHTSALVSMLTSQVGNSLFQKIYEAHGSPTYFEMVVESESEGGHIIRSWPVALHAYTKKAPTGADVTQ